MKKIITLLLFICLQQITNAQSPLIATSKYAYVSGAMLVEDTANYYFSNGRYNAPLKDYNTLSNETFFYDSVKSYPTWATSTLKTKQYNANNQLVDFSNYNWDGANWIKNTRKIMQYDANGNKTKIGFQFAYLNNWNNDYTLNFSYNASNEETSYSKYDAYNVYATDSSTTVPSPNFLKLTYIYSGGAYLQNYKTTKMSNETLVEKYTWNGSNYVWTNFQKTVFYQLTPSSDSTVFFNWNTNTNQWVITGATRLIHGAYQLLSRQDYINTNLAIGNSYEYTYYNEQLNQLSFYSYKTPLPNYDITNQYDVNGNVIVSIAKYYSGGNFSYSNTDTNYYNAMNDIVKKNTTSTNNSNVTTILSQTEYEWENLQLKKEIHKKYNNTTQVFEFNSGSYIRNYYYASNIPLGLNDVLLSIQEEKNNNKLTWEINQNSKLELLKSNNKQTVYRGNIIYQQEKEASRTIFIDTAINIQTTYYVLKIYDLDGKFQYSNVVASSNKIIETEPLLFPNPAKDKLTILQKNFKDYMLFNQFGCLIKTSSNTEINCSHLPLGNYFLKINLNDLTSKTLIFTVEK